MGNSRQTKQWPRMFTGKGILAMLSGCVVTFLGVGGCAAAAPFNPDGLDTARLSEVTSICQNVLGLSPSEAYISGTWTGVGAEELDTVTNHYRGCVASLSYSLRQVAATERARAAEDRCKASGLTAGSPDLALCVLKDVSSAPEARPVDTASTTLASEQLKLAPPFWRASPRLTAQRENVACAALGIEPETGGFDDCVKRLKGTFFSIDNPVE